MVYLAGRIRITLIRWGRGWGKEGKRRGYRAGIFQPRLISGMEQKIVGSETIHAFANLFVFLWYFGILPTMHSTGNMAGRKQNTYGGVSICAFRFSTFSPLLLFKGEKLVAWAFVQREGNI